jgi:hypothetical protein
LIINQAHLRTVLAEYAGHYNTARPHQGIGQRVPDHDPDQQVASVIDLDTARTHRRPVLGGLTSEYQVAVSLSREGADRYGRLRGASLRWRLLLNALQCCGRVSSNSTMPGSNSMVW